MGDEVLAVLASGRGEDKTVMRCVYVWRIQMGEAIFAVMNSNRIGIEKCKHR